MTPLAGQTEFGFVDELPKPAAQPGSCPWGHRSRPKYLGKRGVADRWQCPECRQDWEVIDSRHDGRGGPA